MTDKEYIVILPFMVDGLKLKGNELIMYAIIYGFSRVEGHSFHGSLSYLASMTNLSKRSVMEVLKKLIDKKHIVKKEEMINGIKMCKYSCNSEECEKFTGSEESSPGVVKNLHRGGEESSPNNTNKNTNIYIKEESIKEEKADFTLNDCRKLIQTYTINQDFEEVMYDFCKMRKQINKPMSERALRMKFTQLNTLANTESEKIKIVEQSIANCWQDLYAIGGNKNYSKQPQKKKGLNFDIL